MSTASDVCGCTETTSGEPCELPAGWGTSDEEYCRWHRGGQQRPSKLTHELQERLASLLERGMPVKHAAPACGISRDTYYRWKRDGQEQDEGVLADFSDRVMRARGVGSCSLLEDAITIARENQDARALLKIYQEIEHGGDWVVEDDDEGDGWGVEIVFSEDVKDVPQRAADED